MFLCSAGYVLIILVWGLTFYVIYKFYQASDIIGRVQRGADRLFFKLLPFMHYEHIKNFWLRNVKKIITKIVFLTIYIGLCILFPLAGFLGIYLANKCGAIF